MVSTRKSAAFPEQPKEFAHNAVNLTNRIPPEDWGGPLPVDNPDGVVRAYGIGPYEVGMENGRAFSHGAGTPKGNVGNASGQGKAMRVKGGFKEVK